MNNYITLLTLMNIKWKEPKEELPEVTQLQFESKANKAKDVPIPNEEEIKNKLLAEFKVEAVEFKIAKRSVYNSQFAKDIK